MTSNDQQLDLDAIEALTTNEHLTPGPWTLDRESCDCSDGYCHHGMYVTGVVTPVATAIAAERLARNGEQPRDYDFHRGEIGDFTEADWELMVAAREALPALVAEVRRLRAELAKEEHRHGQTIDDRDRFHDMADKLAYAVAPEGVIGEHSSMNCPWENALDLITPAAEVDKLRARVAELEGHASGVDTLPAWLYWRFTGQDAPTWAALSDDDRAYWEHHARAVRRAVARGGFKTTPAARSAAV